MDIPSLMTAVAPQSDSFIEQAIKYLKEPPGKTKPELLNVWLELDCDQKKITFTPFAYQKQKSEQEFYYLGGNQSSTTQIYVVRAVDSFLSYWVCRMEGIFMNLQKFLPQGELKAKLEACYEERLYSEAGLNFACMEGTAAGSELYRDENNKKKKALKLDGNQLTGEKWLQQVMNLTSKQKIMLIVPVIVSGGERIVISQHPDYVNAIEKFLGKYSNNQKKKNQKMAVCHICGCVSEDIDTDKYSTGLERNSISKVFVTTTTNYAPDFKKKLHQRNFAICKNCYDKWYSGEKEIKQNYRIRIAGEKVVILVDGIMQPLERDELPAIVRKIDAAFYPEEYTSWLESLQLDTLKKQKNPLYEFNLIFYKSSERSCEIRKTIEDVSDIWFQRVLDAFQDIRTKKDYAARLKWFGLGSVYHMVPVRTNKKGEQLDVNIVLELYAAILQRIKIDKKVIWECFARALECGYREITSSELRNTRNLHSIKKYHEQYHQKNTGSIGLEWYIEYMCYAYLAFSEVLKTLDILDSEGWTMDKLAEKDIQEESGKQGIIAEKEAFLERHGFSEEAKGIYYVGAMMNMVGMMQYHQKHIHKPILEKVTYSGMRRRDILRLLCELYEKFVQYRKAMQNQGRGHLVYYFELFAERANAYLQNLPDKEEWDEYENVFYLMSGYTGCIPREKVKEQQEDNQDDE